MAVGVNYNPSAVMMRQPNSPGTPYLGPSKIISPGSTSRPGPNVPSGGVLGAQAIRATGNTPGYDPAYGQNLATYGGGQFSGVTSYNPFNLSTFPGQPTGGGNAPVAGMPNTLLSQAQGGQAFSWNPPATKSQAVSAAPATAVTSLQDWLQQFLQGSTGGTVG